MKKFIKIFVLMALAMCIVTPAFAADKPADNMQILLEKLQADKKLLVAENMQLTEAESKVFWPVYEAYQKDLDAINNRILAMIKSYAEAMKAKAMDDGKAKRLMFEMLSIQSDEVRLMQSYALKMGNVLPATKVTRYLQIENKIRAVIKYELASMVPLVQ